MADVTIENPDEYRNNIPVDDRGRVSVGKWLAGKRVTIVVEVVDGE